jgi:hypothetical protein
MKSHGLVVGTVGGAPRDPQHLYCVLAVQITFACVPGMQNAYPSGSVIRLSMVIQTHAYAMQLIAGCERVRRIADDGVCVCLCVFCLLNEQPDARLRPNNRKRRRSTRNQKKHTTDRAKNVIA